MDEEKLHLAKSDGNEEEFIRIGKNKLNEIMENMITLASS